MRSFLVLIFAAAIMSGCNSSKNNTAANTDSTTSIDTTWKPLFDGKTTKGWHTYGKTEAGRAWKAENGVLHLDASQKGNWQTKNGGDLVTDSEYENFQFSAEWKISRAGNSGIIFLVNEDPKKYPYCWHTGIETQIADNRENEDGAIIKHRAGDLYDLLSISKDHVKPAGEWNKTVVLVSGGVLNIFINDEQVLTTKLWTDNWKKLIADSKFKDYPDFGTFKKGHIALQDHGADVWFRDIKIKRL
ncbi:3-keto-disaccharide hydrolase [Mucilaginibacter psychrotolerans]|uniref:DUF1080 domain-containing protein n=1 Tax=Mucilaginibacter psychrotolerans TaxID=1524096 RepID=A0A4Y8S3F5_9SPHI|nr:DUF1080 domain-containing protein [Mucilaginibacter psychrotolerans]TFF33251.1 DUF1080 domain-containing protein [Mucilaginibacter psychrotolerans]